MPPMQKTCQVSGKPFVISERDQAFYDRLEVPYPEINSAERLRRRVAFRNVRNLYKRKCDKTGKSIISVYRPDAKFPVYHRDEWWADGWEPPAQEFDFNRPFFDQLKELRNKCPRAAVFNKRAINSDYCNVSDGIRDCYLSFVAFDSRDLIHCHRIMKSNDLTDCYYCSNCERCYDCVYCFDSFNLKFCVESKNCRDSAFLYDCIGVKNSFMCTNQRQKEYMIFNEQHTKEEYEAKMAQINFGSYSTVQYLKEKFHEFRRANALHRSNKMDQCEASTGHRLFNCKDAEDCFEIEEGRDILRCVEGTQMKDCADSVSFGGIEKMAEVGYELQECVDFYNFKFSNYCYGKNNIEYSEECHNSTDLFGCIGVKNASFRILNKQYSEAEYPAMKAKVIEHMRKTGEYGWFFPPTYSPFGYNETEGMEYFPLEKQAVLNLGYNWSDYEPPPPEATKVLPADKLPDNITDIPNDVLNWAINCEITGKPFKLVPQELKFYREMNVPVPRRHFDERHNERLRERLVVHLHDRPCTKCGKELQSPYSSDTTKKVYCEECYFSTVY
jgi:hypothetical protein